MRWTVSVPIEGYAEIEVEAADEEEALRKAKQNSRRMEYSDMTPDWNDADCTCEDDNVSEDNG